MAGNKTKATKASVTEFIRSIEDKQALTIYIMPGFTPFDKLVAKLGKYKTGKSCLYIKRLSDVDEDVLERLIDGSVERMRKKYETW